MEALRKDIRSILIAEKFGLTGRQLMERYAEFCGGGSQIPYERFQFGSLHALLSSMPDVCTITMDGNNHIYHGKADESTMHIKEMVNLQRTKRSRRGGNQQARSLGRLSRPSYRPQQRITTRMGSNTNGRVLRGIQRFPFDEHTRNRELNRRTFNFGKLSQDRLQFGNFNKKPAKFGGNEITPERPCAGFTDHGVESLLASDNDTSADASCGGLRTVDCEETPKFRSVRSQCFDSRWSMRDDRAETENPKFRQTNSSCDRMPVSPTSNRENVQLKTAALTNKMVGFAREQAPLPQAITFRQDMEFAVPPSRCSSSSDHTARSFSEGRPSKSPAITPEPTSVPDDEVVLDRILRILQTYPKGIRLKSVAKIYADRYSSELCCDQKLREFVLHNSDFCMLVTVNDQEFLTTKAVRPSGEIHKPCSTDRSRDEPKDVQANEGVMARLGSKFASATLIHAFLARLHQRIYESR